MAPIEVTAEGQVAAPAPDVYGYIADMSTHPHFLPPAFSDFTVVSGGTGAGTVISYTITVGGRSRPYRTTVGEPEPGRVITETDTSSSLVTTFTVTPDGDSASRVQISTTWQGAGGIGGFFERTFAPRALRSLYADELARLDAYARAQHG